MDDKKTEFIQGQIQDALGDIRALQIGLSGLYEQNEEQHGGTPFRDEDSWRTWDFLIQACGQRANEALSQLEKLSDHVREA